LKLLVLFEESTEGPGQADLRAGSGLALGSVI